MGGGGAGDGEAMTLEQFLAANPSQRREEVVAASRLVQRSMLGLSIEPYGNHGHEAVSGTGRTPRAIVAEAFRVAGVR